jgi:hypothetical protein
MAPGKHRKVTNEGLLHGKEKFSLMYFQITKLSI